MAVVAGTVGSDWSRMVVVEEVTTMALTGRTGRTRMKRFARARHCTPRAVQRRPPNTSPRQGRSLRGCPRASVSELRDLEQLLQFSESHFPRQGMG